MFELSFGKMMIIAVVALIVLGPEKLPRVARTIGHLLGRARSYANQVKQDIDREMQMDELRKLQQQAQDAARQFETAVNDAGREVESQVGQVQSAVEAHDQLSNATAENSIAPPEPASETPAAEIVAEPIDDNRPDELKQLDAMVAEARAATEITEVAGSSVTTTTDTTEPEPTVATTAHDSNKPPSTTT